MSELAFTLARIGFLVLLWVFVLLTLRALRRDVADMASYGLFHAQVKPNKLYGNYQDRKSVV